LQETRNCYLYEKVGYRGRANPESSTNDMTLVGYEKVMKADKKWVRLYGSIYNFWYYVLISPCEMNFIWIGCNWYPFLISRKYSLFYSSSINHIIKIFCFCLHVAKGLMIKRYYLYCMVLPNSP
jgi:hypothetical protein